MGLDASYMCPVVMFLPEEMAKQFPDEKWESRVADWWTLMQLARLLPQEECRCQSKCRNSISDMLSEVPMVEPERSASVRQLKRNIMSCVHHLVQGRKICPLPTIDSWLGSIIKD